MNEPLIMAGPWTAKLLKEIEAEDKARSRIIVTLEITDPETVMTYKDVDDALVFEDLRYGTLMDKAEFVDRTNLT
jgi:hypothetical protein